MFTVDAVAKMFKRHFDKTPYGISSFIDESNPECVVMDCWLNLSTFVDELNERVQKE